MKKCFSITTLFYLSRLNIATSLLLFLFSSGVLLSQELQIRTRGMGFVSEPPELSQSIPSFVHHSMSLPPSVDNSEQFPLPLDQGTQNSSSAFSVALSKTGLEKKLQNAKGLEWSFTKKKKIDYSKIFSPAFIYNSLNRSSDSGISIIESLLFINQYGITTWDQFPYSPINYLIKPNEKILQSAQTYQGTDFSKISCTDIPSIKTAIYFGYPVVSGILLYSSFLDLQTDTYTYKENDTFIGAHSLTIVGYNDSKRAFKVLNTWSDKWGNKGYAYIDYQWFSKTCRAAYLLKNMDSVEDNEGSILQRPVAVTASKGDFSNKVLLHWDKVSHSIGYEVYRKEPFETTYTLIGKSTMEEFEDTGVINEVAYYYKVRAIGEYSTSSLSSDNSFGYASNFSTRKLYIPKVHNLTARKHSDKVILEWSSTETNFEVFEYNANKDQFLSIGKTKKTTFRDKLAKNNSLKIYRVAVIKAGKVGELSHSILANLIQTEKDSIPSTKRDTKLSAPQKLQANIDKESMLVKVKWKKVPEAVSYNVWYKAKGDTNWTLVENTDRLYSQMSLPEKEKFYLYSVTAISIDTIESENSGVASVVFSVALPSGYKPRIFGNVSKLEKFKGRWTGIQWNEKTGPKNLLLKIESVDADNSHFKIDVDTKKVYEGKYIEGSPVIEVEDSLKIELAFTEDALIVILNDKDIFSQKEELSFLRE
jgi:fibronectin type 3 domain-containing protein